MSEQTQIAVVELPQELEQLKSTAVGLPVDKADRIIMSFAPSMTKLTELSMEMEKVNFESPSDLDAEIARKIRLKMVPERTGAGKKKDELKEDMKREDKLIMACCNLVVSAYEMKEKKLKEVEDFRAREAERLRLLKVEERKALIEPYSAAFDANMLGAMTDEVFANYLTGVKANYEAQKEAERKAEEDRIAREKAEQEERERIAAENKRLKEEAEAKEKALAEERAKADAERKAAELKAQQEREAAEALLRAEQEKARKEREAAELKAKQERDALEAKLAAERAERARIEAEQHAAAVAAQRAKEAEEKARKLAEKKAAAAPDKTKLEGMLNQVNMIPFPEMKTDDGQESIAAIRIAFNALVNEIKKQISEL